MAVGLSPLQTATCKPTTRVLQSIPQSSSESSPVHPPIVNPKPKIENRSRLSKYVSVFI